MIWKNQLKNQSFKKFKFQNIDEVKKETKSIHEIPKV